MLARCFGSQYESRYAVQPALTGDIVSTVVGEGGGGDEEDQKSDSLFSGVEYDA